MPHGVGFLRPAVREKERELNATTLPADPLRRARDLADMGSFTEAIEELTRANRERPDPELEAELVQLRHAACASLPAVDPARPWPPDQPDPFPDVVGDVPEIDRAALTAPVLGGALQHHGSLLVRGLVDPATATELREAIDAAFDAFDAADGDTPAVPTPTATPTITPTPVLSGALSQLPAGDLALETPTPAPLDDGSGGAIPGSVGSGPALPTRSPFPFDPREVRYEANDNDQGCEWRGVAGTLTTLSGDPVVGLAIAVEGESFRQVVFSGSADRWGAGGFEIRVGTEPHADAYTLTVIGPSGAAISPDVTFETGSTCETNVAVLDLVQNHAY